MRRVLLTIAMLLMGMALVGGAAAALVPTSLLPLDQEVGTHTSAAGAVLGIGLMAAAINPPANVAWVRAGILYGLVVVAFEGGAHFLLGASFHIGPVFFGLAFSLLLIALYPHRKELVPERTGAAKKTEPPQAVDTAKPAEKKTATASEPGPEPPPPSGAATK